MGATSSTIDFFLHSFLADSIGRFVNQSLLTVYQKIFFINFNFKTCLSYKASDAQIIRKSLTPKDTMTVIYKISFHNKFQKFQILPAPQD